MEKKEKLKKFHQTNILEVAKCLFIEKGFVQTTMDDIAKEADYSKSTLYVYFKSKDEIYNYIIYENMMSLKKLVENAINQNDTEHSVFIAVCNAHVALQRENPLFLKV